MAVTEGVGFEKGEREKGKKLAFIEAKRAHFYAKEKRHLREVARRRPLIRNVRTVVQIHAWDERCS